MKDYASIALGGQKSGQGGDRGATDYAARALASQQPGSAVEAAPAENGDMPWREVAVQAWENMPESSWNFATSLAEPFMHPIDTAKGLWMLASGTVQKAIPGRQKNEVAFDAFVDEMGDRYGGLENVKKTLAQDPVGVLADAAGVLAGGGAVLKGASVASKSSRLAKAGRAASRAANIIDPVNVLVAQPVARTAGALAPTKAAEKLYMSALKPSTKISPEARSKMFRTAYTERISPTMSGAEKAGRRMGEIDDQLEAVIRRGAEAGDKLNVDDVVRRADDLNAEYYANTVNPQAAEAAIGLVKNRFSEAFGPEMPVDKAQAVKRTQGHELRKKYGERTTVADEAKKAIVRGLKEELANKYPELSKLNAKQGDLIALNNEIERAVARMQNNNVIGLYDLVGALTGMSAGAILSGGSATGSALGMMAGLSGPILRQPGVSAKLAIALARARKLPNFGTKGTAATEALRMGGKAGQFADMDEE